MKGRKGEDSKKRVVLQDDCSTETQMQEWRARLTAARERRLALSSLQPQRDMLNSVNTSSTTGNEDPAGNGHRAADLDTNGSHDPEEIGRLITFVDGQKHRKLTMSRRCVKSKNGNCDRLTRQHSLSALRLLAFFRAARRQCYASTNARRPSSLEDIAQQTLSSKMLWSPTCMADSTL